MYSDALHTCVNIAVDAAAVAGPARRHNKALSVCTSACASESAPLRLYNSMPLCLSVCATVPFSLCLCASQSTPLAGPVVIGAAVGVLVVVASSCAQADQTRSHP